MTETPRISRRPVTEALNRLAFCAELMPEESKALGVHSTQLSQLSWSIRSLDGEFGEALQRGSVRQLPGMNDALYDVVTAATQNRRAELQTQLESLLPPGLFDIQKIPGLGPKKIKDLWRILDINSLAELSYACNENRLVELKGFGQKTQDKVIKHIDAVQKTLGHIRLDRALLIAKEVQYAFAQSSPGGHLTLSGGLSRVEESVKDIELLFQDSDAGLSGVRAQEILEELTGSEAELILDDEDDSLSVHAHFRESPIIVYCITDAERAGAQSVYASADTAFKTKLTAHAKGKGLVFDALGLAGVETPDEASFFKALDLAFTDACRRYENVPLTERAQTPSTRLLTLADLQGALHNHTQASDGKNTLEEMREAAASRGLSYLGISEHSETAVYAGGLAHQELQSQIKMIESLNAQGHSCTLLTGIESDIKKEGALDYDDETLASLDVVIASIHARHTQDPAALTECMVNAVKHPSVHIIGHPTGRLLLGRPPSEYDMERFFEACKKHHTLVEMNANPARLDLSARHLSMAKSMGVKVSIAADAHSVGALADLEYGVMIARRAGLVCADVINTLPLDEMLSSLAVGQ